MRLIQEPVNGLAGLALLQRLGVAPELPEHLPVVVETLRTSGRIVWHSAMNCASNHSACVLRIVPTRRLQTEAAADGAELCLECQLTVAGLDAFCEQLNGLAGLLGDLDALAVEAAEMLTAPPRLEDVEDGTAPAPTGTDLVAPNHWAYRGWLRGVAAFIEHDEATGRCESGDPGGRIADRLRAVRAAMVGHQLAVWDDYLTDSGQGEPGQMLTAQMMSARQEQVLLDVLRQYCRASTREFEVPELLEAAQAVVDSAPGAPQKVSDAVLDARTTTDVQARLLTHPAFVGRFRLLALAPSAAAGLYGSLGSASRDALGALAGAFDVVGSLTLEQSLASDYGFRASPALLVVVPELAAQLVLAAARPSGAQRLCLDFGPVEPPHDQAQAARLAAVARFAAALADDLQVGPDGQDLTRDTRGPEHKAPLELFGCAMQLATEAALAPA